MGSVSFSIFHNAAVFSTGKLTEYFFQAINRRAMKFYQSGSSPRERNAAAIESCSPG